MKRPLISCRALIDFLDDYVEQRLSAAERERFEEHLAVCAACVRYLDGYRGTLRALAVLARETEVLPQEVPEELVEAILAARPATAD
jgi:anti-sigma factor RsiW